MRVLFTTNAKWFFASHRLPLAIEWTRRGAEVHVASPPDETQFDYPHHPIRMDKSGLSPLEVRSILDLRKVIKRVRPDIVHNVSLKPALYGTIAAGRIPVVNSITGLGHAFVSQTQKMRLARQVIEQSFARLGRRADYILQTASDRDVFAPLVPKTHLIAGSGVDTEVFRYSEPHDNPIVLYAGRMLSTKGVYDFIEASKHVDAEFWLAGTPNPGNPASLPESELKGTPCKWLGHIEDMPRLMARASVVCLPSVYGEGIPRVLIEACASGRPIIATDIPGCREVCRHGVNGLLVPPGDPVSLAQCISGLLDDPEKRKRFSVAGRLIAETEFDVHLVVSKTFRIYESMI